MHKLDFHEVIMKEHQMSVSTSKNHCSQDVQIICQDGELWCSRIMLYFMEPSMKAVLLDEDNSECVLIYQSKVVEDFIGIYKASSIVEEDFSFITEQEIEAEVDVKPECSDKNFSCEMCGRNYRTLQQLKSHKWSKHKIEEKHFKCCDCEKKFMHKYELTKHMFKHMKPMFVCEFCDKRLKRRNDLVEHYKLFHQDTPTPVFNCLNCPATFSRQSNLTRHFKSYHAKADFNCSQCSATFSRNDNLQRHINKKHSSL